MKRKKHKVITGLLILVLLFGVGIKAFAAYTYVVACSRDGTVTATYKTIGGVQNGYYGIDTDQVVINYTPPSVDSCHTISYFSITSSVTPAGTDGINVWAGGHFCDGHTSTTASWRHVHGSCNMSPQFQIQAPIGSSLTVPKSVYDSAAYVVGTPSITIPDGISNNIYGWVVSYQSLPSVSYPADVDNTVPDLSVTATASGRTATVSGKTWGTEAIINAASTDAQSRPNNLRFYNGSTSLKTSSNTGNTTNLQDNCIVNANANYTVWAADKVGNEISKGITVDFIDTVAPELAVTATASGRTATVNGKTWGTEAVINTRAADVQSRPDSLTFYSNGILTKTDHNVGEQTDLISTLIVSDNMGYAVKAVDKVGNEVSKEIAIDYIDRTEPDLAVTVKESGKTVIVNGKTWATEAIIQAESTDTQSSPGSLEFYKDGTLLKTNSNVGEQTDLTSALTVSGNSTYNVQSADKVENKVSQDIIVDCIDITAPSIDFTMDNQIPAKRHILTVTASDAQSGLPAQAYSFDGKNWTGSNTLTVSEAGAYRVRVRDKIGNESTQVITVGADMFVRPKIIPKMQPKSSRPKSLSKSSPRLLPRSGIQSLPVPKQKVLPSPGQYMPQIPESKQEQKVAKPILQKPFLELVSKSVTKIRPETIAWTAIVGGIIGFALFLFLLLYSVRIAHIYEIINTGELILGRVWFFKIKKGYKLLVPNRILKKASGNLFIIKFSPKFADKKAGCPIIIKLPKTKINMEVQPRICFKYHKSDG